MNHTILLAQARVLAETGEAGGGSMLMILLMYAVLIGGAYLFFFRPQKKKRKKEEELKKGATVGDEITTIGGISGRIVAIKDDTDSVILETGADRTKLRIKRWAIGSVDTVKDESEVKAEVKAK